jgi:hypothetical protein
VRVALGGAVPPGLGEGAGGDVDGKTCGVGFVEEGLHPAVGSFDGDEGAGVEGDSGHRLVESEGGTGPAAVVFGGHAGFGGHVGEEWVRSS